MTSILGLDFIGDKVHAALVEGAAASARVTAAFSATWPKDLAPANASELGTWLRQQLAQHRIRTNDAACCVGRGLAAFRTISLPDCPSEEVAGMVAFAVDESGTNPQVVDFQTSPPTGGERKVTVATLSPRLVETFTAVLNAAGLSCKRLEFRPYGLRFLADRLLGDDNGGQDLLVVPMADGLEISVWTGMQLETTRVVANGDAAGAARLPAELRRTLVSFHAANAGAAVSRVAVLADDSSAYAASLRSYPDQPVSMLNPRERIQGMAETGAELGAVSVAWHALSGVRPVIDFFNPRKPPPPSNRKRKMVLTAAAAAALLFATGFAWWTKRVTDYDNDIDLLQLQVTNLNVDLKKGEPALKLHQDMKTWLAGKVDWLDEFTDLAGCMPPTYEGFVKTLKGNIVKGGEHRIEVHPRARDQEAISWFIENMAVLPGWEPQSMTVTFLKDATDFKATDSIVVSMTPHEPQPGKKAEPKQPLVYKDPEGKRRRPVGEGIKLASASTPVAPAGGGRGRRDPPPASTSGSPNPTASPPAAADTSADDALTSEVKKVAAMEYAEREKYIEAKPRILQKRFREAVTREMEKKK